MELPRIPKDRSKKYEYKGQEISVNQMAKYTGRETATIRNKLRNGVSIKEILENKLTPELALTKEQLKKKRSKSLTTKMIQERIANGWCLDLALELSALFVGPVDNIVYKTKAGGLDIEIPYKKILKLEEVGITARTISIRVGRGMSLEEAMNPQLNDEEAVDYERLDEFNEQVASAGLRRYRAEKRRKTKPHLETVPQSHKLSDYGRYLMNRPGIARQRTDLYGNVQLI
ncbi:SA1788 family PVL leukocidin-associated protein [Staphylococcus rostri]|uniref:SA1788 family PVL leukocidin-associated protein n=1 Tax=Staphylococcus rostri TaxID=522262 RepID=UPI00285279F6|nr:SA1788 family PVL leukocidin-associated protein [Staphylococcus rostri]